MGGITSGVGIFSGIDTRSLIDQLLAIDARPKMLAQQRLVQLQVQQSAFLDLNSRLNSLKEAAASFRLNKTFDTKNVASSDSTVLTGSASASAVSGTYSFLVDRLVSTRQLLSRGFADADATALGATSFTVEGAEGRLDRDVALADLNGGQGAQRGTIVISEAGGGSATVDLSKAVNVSDVLAAINGAAGINVTASISGGHFVITQGSGLNLTIADGSGSQTATDLGIIASGTSATVTGSDVYVLSANTPLSALNDGNGVFISTTVSTTRSDFTISVGGGALINVNIGAIFDDSTGSLVETAPAESSVGGVINRINQALSAAGETTVTAAISSDGTGITITDTMGRTLDVSETGTDTTAADLGILTSAPVSGGTLTGRRVLAGLNSTLARSLNGGQGIGDGQLTITDRAGTVHSITLDPNASVDEILSQFSAQSGGAITAALDTLGSGLVVTDTTGATTSNLIIAGTGGATDTATALNISTGPSGVAAATASSGNLDHQYVTRSTLLSSLRDGRGVGTGRFRITDSLGATAVVDIDETSKTIDDIIKEINSKGLQVKARINDKGDGIIVEEDLSGGGVPGSIAIKIEDESGAVARNLNLAGTASGVDPSNFIDGSFERTISLDVADTLQDVVSKFNAAGVGATASIINDGTGVAPFRLSITSKESGVAGRFILDTGGLDLGLSTIDEGNDAVIFFGSTDPAKAVLLTSSTNTLDNFLTGVSIDLKSASTTPVTLNVTTDTDSIASAVDDFLSAFNTAIDRIDFQTRFVADTEERGALLGDSTALQLRAALFSTIQSEGQGLTGSFKRLVDVGVQIGEGGKLSLNRDQFRAALEEDPDGVKQLFEEFGLQPKGDIVIEPGITVSGGQAPDTFSSIGVAGLIEQLAKTYIGPVDGILTTKKGTLDTQISLQQDRIAAFDVQLENRRKVLERQFLAMEQAIAALQSQQSALGQLTQLG